MVWWRITTLMETFKQATFLIVEVVANMTFSKHEMEETLMSKSKVTDHSISRFIPSDFCSPEDDITWTFLFQLLKVWSCTQIKYHAGTSIKKTAGNAVHL